MKKLLFGALALIISASATYAQEVVKPGAYTLTRVIDNKATSVKDQASSGTCWAYSAIAAIESDIIKAKGDKFENIDLSELYVARHSYYDRFVKYIRLHGSMNFAEGGSFEDVVDAIDRYGIVPQEAYEGLNYGYNQNAFGEVWAALKGYADAILLNKNKKLSTAWREGFDGILDAYFGVSPETFTYEGKTYTPQSFAEYLGFNKSDYISFCSFTHVPYGEMHIIEVPDNWNQGASLNVELDELVALHDEALMNGYTTAWGADVSESGFSHRTGLCLFTATSKEQIPGNEQDKWDAAVKTKKDGQPQVAIEREVTPELRQAWYDNWETTDDHGMQITGIYKDQDGKTFYKVKNSWAEDSNSFGGYFWASETFFRAKTLNFMIHKNALSNKTKKSLGI